MDYPAHQKQWQTFLLSVTLTVEEVVPEKVPISVTLVSTSAMLTLWSVSMSAHQDTPSTMATAMIQMLPLNNVIHQ